MPPIQLSRSERASLRKMFERPCLVGEIPADHEEKFINYALARKRVLLLYITSLGQLELLRQRFRNLRPPVRRPKALLPGPKRLLLTDEMRGRL